MNTFNQPREATIQFSDVFGEVPMMGTGAKTIADFDAALTAQVRNTNRFIDAQFPIGLWPDVGDYAAVLIEQLRQEQIDHAAKLGIKPEDASNEDLHPDHRQLATSLGRTLVVIVNCAPRTTVHRDKNVNGDEFYVAVTKAGNEIYAQLPYFRGLQARGLVVSLYRIPNNAGPWANGEQFRSSLVTRARTKPEALEQVELATVATREYNTRLAYADKFGNVRLEVADLQKAQQLLEGNQQVTLRSQNDRTLAAHVVRKLTDIPEGEIGIYFNPSEKFDANAPGFLELSRRVSNPNGQHAHAYSVMLEQLAENHQDLVAANLTITA